jgi:aminopeptidase N
MTQRRRLAPLAFAALAVVAGAALGAREARAQEDTTLRLPIGDPARRERTAPVALDAVTDTRTGELLTPAQMAERLAGARLVLFGESHTEMDFHRAQLRLVEELHRAGRPVLLGLEMYPYTAQESLDRWARGLLTEEGFVELSDWYEHWGYAWGYYRDLFLFARQEEIPLFALNAPREVVTSVRQKGFENLTPEEAAHIPREIDTGSEEHRTLFKSFFGADDPLHAGMTDEQWDAMISAQATWDATMAHNAVRVLRERGSPAAGAPQPVLVVLVGSGHVAYGLGIQRQAERWFDGRIASVIPVPVRDEEGEPVAEAQASYADFLWGLPPGDGPLYPSLGASTVDSAEPAGRRVIFVSEGTVAERAGIRAGDVLVAFDGKPVRSKGDLNRAVAAKRWGDAATVTVVKEGERVEVPVIFRRSL